MGVKVIWCGPECQRMSLYLFYEIEISLLQDYKMWDIGQYWLVISCLSPYVCENFRVPFQASDLSDHTERKNTEGSDILGKSKVNHKCISCWNFGWTLLTHIEKI